ncbi:hypothetical protein QOZ96_003599 [Brevundimonas nasdae]|nr:hypothetical protein [Brevundimonas nasdae]
MKAVEQYARNLAVKDGLNPDARREPRTAQERQAVREGKPAPKVWMDYVSVALSALAEPPANSARISLRR